MAISSDQALRILERWIGKGPAYDDLRLVHEAIQNLQQVAIFQRERAEENHQAFLHLRDARKR